MGTLFLCSPGCCPKVPRVGISLANGDCYPYMGCPRDAVLLGATEEKKLEKT
jgi:hypothetical protein